MVHAEACRHRGKSRSVASNRAIPTHKILKMVAEDKCAPIFWGANNPGMQSKSELSGLRLLVAKFGWALGRRSAILASKIMLAAGAHKQIANRPLAPYQWVTEIVTAHEDVWHNFFALRVHEDAQPEMFEMARLAAICYFGVMPHKWQADTKTTPCGRETPAWVNIVHCGGWHIPLVSYEEIEALIEDCGYSEGTRNACIISAARCARTSNLSRFNSDKLSTFDEDSSLYGRLTGQIPLHISPTEHQLEALARRAHVGPMVGWRSFRYLHKEHTIYNWSLEDLGHRNLITKVPKA
jgi:hypothetical protein